MKTGAYLPIYIKSSNISLIQPFNFLLDTGASLSAISAYDLGSDVDYSIFEKSDFNAFGVGGSQKFYIIRSMELFFLNTENIWKKGCELDRFLILPPVYESLTNKQFSIPSILGLDVIGKYFSLYFDDKEVYLESI